MSSRKASFYHKGEFIAVKEGIIYILTDRGNVAKKRRQPFGRIEQMNIIEEENTGLLFYLQNAIISARSLKKHMPEKHVTLFTDHEFSKELAEQLPFDDIVDFGPVERDFWCKKWEVMQRSPYDYTVHLDSDTFVCDTFQEIFTMIEDFNFDFAATLSLTYQTSKMYKKLLCFPELAGGVLAWRKNSKVEEFMKLTHKYILERRRGADEPYMRMALLHSDIRYVVMPWEYNCWHTYPLYLFGKVKILHGKSSSLEENEKIINHSVYGNGRWPWIRLLTGNKALFFKKLSSKIIEISE